MMQIGTLVESVLADELAAARDSGGAIGYVGHDVPMDVLLGSGRFVSHLPWTPGRSTDFADRWLEASFAPWARSMLEDWATGRFDFMETVVFSRGDDCVQRLYYYICELQRRGVLGGPPALIFDVAKIDRDSSVERTIAGVGKLAAALGVEGSALLAGIEKTNRRRKIFVRLDSERAGPGVLYDKLSRATLFADLDEQLADVSGTPLSMERRVLLAGSAPPDERLHAAVEDVGWVVSGELHERSLSRLGMPLNRDIDDALTAIGRHVHQLALGPRSFGARGAKIVAAAQKAGARAVVLWLHAQDEGLAWTVPAQTAALTEAGIPVLVAADRRWDADDGVVEEIQAFLRGLEP